MSPEEHSEGLPLLISGSLDYVSESSVEGWAFDPASPERKVQVTVIVNERDVWTGLADQLRPDLVEAGIGDGLHAFYADISNEDLGTGYAEIRAVVTSTGHNLSQSPALLEVTQVAPRNIPVKPPVVLAPTKDVAAEAQPPPPPRPIRLSPAWTASQSSGFRAGPSTRARRTSLFPLTSSWDRYCSTGRPHRHIGRIWHRPASDAAFALSAFPRRSRCWMGAPIECAR